MTANLHDHQPGWTFSRCATLLGVSALFLATSALSGCGDTILDTKVDIFEIKSEDTQVTYPDTPTSDSEADSTDAILKPVCETKLDCPTPGNLCLEAWCTPAGECATRPAPEGISCVDGNPCTADNRCKGGECLGVETDCSDGSPCTLDFCDPKVGCVHQPVEAPCNTDNPCQFSLCKDGGCEVVDEDVCDDGNPCTKDTCDPKLGCQFFALTDVVCSDGDGCTVADICLFGVCKGSGKSCNDGNPCTQDTCDLAGDCTYTASFEGQKCNDGLLCTVKDACTGGICAGLPKSCDDHDDCSADSCVPATGACQFQTLAPDTACSDNNPCTVGDHCNQAGACVAGVTSGCDDGNPCTASVCDPTTGKCQHPLLDDGLPCTLLDKCLLNPTCKAGACSGTPNPCDDNNPCTSDNCDGLSGDCISSALVNGTACGEDGKVCTDGLCL